jgi:hypothetical protein
MVVSIFWTNDLCYAFAAKGYLHQVKVTEDTIHHTTPNQLALFRFKQGIILNGIHYKYS